MLFFGNFNLHDSRLDRKRFASPGKILFFGRSLPYLQVRRKNYGNKLNTPITEAVATILRKSWG